MNRLFKFAASDLLLEYIKHMTAGSRFEGHVFLVGGAVRDELLGNPSKDIDLVVSLPNGGIELANFLGNKIDKEPIIYERFGTAMLNFDGRSYKGHEFSKSDQVEFVQTRKEAYSGTSRKPSTEYGTLEEDASRRDFTINALYKDIFTEEIIDVTGKGIKDLRHRVLRTTSDAGSIFKEDPLRMLRAIRFLYKLHLKPDASLVNGIKESARFIHNISSERIRDEFNKILVLDEPDEAMRFMRSVGLMQEILPELEKLHGLQANPNYHAEDALEHSFEVLKNTPPELLARLSGLMHDVGKGEAKEWLADKGYYTHHGHDQAGAAIVRDILTRLKYDNNTIDIVSDVVANHMWSLREEPTEKATARFLNKIKADVDLLLTVMEADRIKSHLNSGTSGITQHQRIFRTINENVENIKNRLFTTKTKPKITGNDIMDRFGLSPGPEVGRLLNLALEYVYDNPDAEKEEILDYLSGLPA